MRNTERPVLVVDDNPSMRRILRGVLAHLGFPHVQEAADGASAIEKMRERQISLVIADLDVDFLRAVRAHALLKLTPIIVISSEAGEDRICAAKTAGASDYLVKPFTAEILKQKIDAALAIV